MAVYLLPIPQITPLCRFSFEMLHYEGNCQKQDKEERNHILKAKRKRLDEDFLG
ncbi:MAG: hypothetical protein ABSE05_16100 [Syntrophales bacterium]|jgi:hypothetical protein